MRQAPSGLAVPALALGGAHAVVDAVSAFVLFRYLALPGAEPASVVVWIVVYDLLAFALQAPIGWFVDRRPAYRQLALLGLAGLALALVVGPEAPRLAAVIAGLANALFHVGAGAHVLRVSGSRAREIGLFVGPGALGLSLGILLGRSALPGRAGLVLALALAALAAARTLPARERPAVAAPPALAPAALGRLAAACCALLLLTVVVRSLAGDTLAHGWRERSGGVLLALAVTAMAGKMLGGIAADRLGWSPTAGLALLVAAPAAVFGLGAAVPALLGMLLLQTTMPLTLKAVHRVLPDRPGLAFGMASAALVVGAGPGLLSAWPLADGPLLLGAVWLSAAALVAGLRLAPAAAAAFRS